MAFLINAYFIASIKGGIWLNAAANVFGFHFPQTLPQWLVDLFTVGIGSKGIAVSSTPTAAGQFNPPDWNKKFEVGGEFAGMKYFDYGMFIMGGASLIISWIDNTSAQYLFSGFGVMMIIYSGLNIQERYKD